jgi:hypothetical protein
VVIFARERRATIADWMILLGALALAASLFLPWSHQFSPSLLARYGSSPLLRGVPHDPTAWQVYSIVDGLLAALALALALAAAGGGRTVRLIVTGFVLLALAFTVHALRVPPTNGANIVDNATRPATYLANTPRSGFGETVALAGLVVTVLGLGLSLTVD